MNSFAKRLRSPYVAMPLITFSLIMVWVAFQSGNLKISYDTYEKSTNILTNPTLEEIENSLPTGWNVENSGDLLSKSEIVEGVVDPVAFRVSVADYADGSLLIASPQIPVSPSEDYFFKALYTTDTHLDVLAEHKKSDGTIWYEHLSHYPDYDYPLSALGEHFRSGKNDASVRIILCLSHDGYLELDSAYAKRATGDEHTSESSSGQKTSPVVFDFEKDTKTKAVGSRRGTAHSATLVGSNGGYAQLVSDEIIPVSEHQLYNLSFTLESSQQVEFGVEYHNKNGDVTFGNIRTIYPQAKSSRHKISFETQQKSIGIRPYFKIVKPGSYTVSSPSLHELTTSAVFDKPRVSITFDDGWMSSYDNGTDVLDDYNYKATYYINPGALGTAQFMTEQQVDELKNQGHQVASHGQNHIDITLRDMNAVTSELTDSYNFINELGYSSIDYASPYGKYDFGVDPSVRELYNSHRGTEIGINTKNNFDQYNLKGLFMRKEVTPEMLQSMIDEAILNNGWLILIYHQIEPSESPFALDRRTFENQMQILNDSVIEVQTVEQALSELAAD